MKHEYQDLIAIFDNTFFEAFQTRLELGTDEPIYLPANEQVPFHRIIFANGFFSSALHEISHWCVAGPQRRLLEDFGYWYEPDGRTQARQEEFERVEVRPQAYEWILSQSAGFPFTVSCDNLNGDFEPDRIAFMTRVHREVLDILQKGLPLRVQLLSDALRAFYRTPPLTEEAFFVT